jgi:hypothetical protein
MHKIIRARENSKFQWLLCPSGINGDNLNIRREASSFNAETPARWVLNDVRSVLNTIGVR